jgi:hypothetical protein
MRHCDKDVKVRDKRGKIRIRDKRDIFGDGHCSSKGKERSSYIATLFVENDEFQGLLNATEMASTAVKPQFPTPLKVYALNDARYNKDPNKEHQNFREIETVTPLADKFHLAVNESFGVNEEGDLATDFFTSLSQSVKMNMDKSLGITDRGKEADLSEDEMNTLRLCQNGMTVVNWKHSLIPNLARALGCGKDEGCPKKYQGKDFDTVWVITYKLSVPLVDAKPQLPNNVAPLEEVEALSMGLDKSSKSSKKKHNRKLKSDPSANNDVISWEISAQTVNEGFDQV